MRRNQSASSGAGREVNRGARWGAGCGDNRGARGAGNSVVLTLAMLAGLSGTLAGCSTQAEETDAAISGSNSSSASGTGEGEDLADSTSASDSGADDSADFASSTGEVTSSAASDTYRDGTYSATGVYGTANDKSIDVELTLEDGIITSVEVAGNTDNAISITYQNQFIAAIDAAVVGQPIANLEVDKVGGASATSEAFNDVLEDVRAQASQ